MRLSIIPIDRSVYLNGIGYSDLDMSWVPDIDGKKVHAVQWYDTKGEVEFVGPDQNLEITELGIFQTAVNLWNERKEEEDALLQKRLEEEERLKKEHEERVRSQFISFDDEDGISIENFDDFVDEVVAETYIPPTPNHIPPVEPLLPNQKVEEDDEDEDLFYDIEELLKEI
jgi:hypothetical protein